MRVKNRLKYPNQTEPIEISLVRTLNSLKTDRNRSNYTPTLNSLLVLISWRVFVWSPKIFIIFLEFAKIHGKIRRKICRKSAYFKSAVEGKSTENLQIILRILILRTKTKIIKHSRINTQKNYNFND
jgi:hypothetical protein